VHLAAIFPASNFCLRLNLTVNHFSCYLTNLVLHKKTLSAFIMHSDLNVGVLIVVM